MTVPFGVYDFFAYLSSGLVLLAAVDVGLGSGLLLVMDASLIPSLLLVILAYVAGQLTAQISATLLEKGLVLHVLGPPSRNLLLTTKEGAFRKVFPGYSRALPVDTIARIRSAAAARGFESDGEALFLHAYACVTKDVDAQARLDAFRNQYGFARNMTVALGASAASLGIGVLVLDRAFPAWVPALALLGAVGMLYRFLKFFRQYAYQLLITYAELRPEDDT
jgi:hypothetical protein